VSSTIGKVVGVALVATLALAWAAAPVAEAQPPIRIGATVAQTGGYATNGQPFLHSYQLRVKHTNDQGGVLGRQLELVVHDDASDPARRSVSMNSSSRGTRWIWCSVR